MISSPSMAQKIEPIAKDTPAHFDGFLVPAPSYKTMLDQALQRDAVKAQLDQCTSEKSKLTETNPYSWFAWGALLGLGFGIAYHK